MSDVERWLQNQVSEGTEEDDIVSKEEMSKSFSCKSDIKVGRELFFDYLGLALSRLEYKSVVPTIKKCRRVGYKGLILLSAPVSDKKAQSCDKNFFYWNARCGHLILSELDSEMCKMLIEIFVTFLVTAERVIFDKV